MKNKILLVDGSSYIYRAFHTPSLSRLTTPTGELSGTTFGFNRSLNLLLENHKPSHCCVVFDPRGKTQRNEFFPQYKANRPPTPEEIIKAFSQIKELLTIRSIKQIQVEKQEADDVIGSLSQKLSTKDNEIIIASGDKDLAQLVSHNIVLTNIKKGEIESFDREGIKEKMGVFPEQVADYLALMGDSVDNIPGIKGVGTKTAVKLLNEYQNMQGIIEKLPTIQGKVSLAIEKEKENIPLYVRLTQINCQIPLSVSLQDLQIVEKSVEQREQEKQYYKKMGFVSELSKLEAGQENKIFAEFTEKDSLQSNNIITKNLDEWLKKISQVEKKEDCLFFIQEKEFIFASFLSTESFIGIEKKQLQNYSEQEIEKKIEENIKQKIYTYDAKALWYETKIKPSTTQFVDLMLLFYLLYAGKFSSQWKNARKELLRLKQQTQEIEEEKPKQERVETKTLFTFLLELFRIEIERNRQLKELYKRVEQPLQNILISIEEKGFFVDKDNLQKIDTNLTQQIQETTAKIYTLSKEPFNIDSPKQVGEVLYNKMHLPILQKTPTGTPSTNEETLQRLAQEGYVIAQEIIAYRGLSKLQSTYTKGLLKHISPQSRIHTKLNQMVTATGRLSSSDPNLQNIPIKTANGRLIRKAFCAPEGRLLMAADYSQIELRILAHHTQDEQLIKAFKQGQDIHSVTAAKVFKLSEKEVSPEQRRQAKTINFGLIYGMSAFSLSKQLKISLQEAKDWIETYFKQFPKIQNYMEEVKKLARKQEMVETFMGRKIHIPDINNRNYKLKNYAERAAINAPIQGAAADVIKLVMVKIFEKIKDVSEIELVLQVHDELLFEVDEEKASEYKVFIQKEMQQAVSLSVPLDVQIGVAKSWDEAH